MDIWYLYHSGFAVKTSRHFLIFDYWRDIPKDGKLPDGVINAAEIADEDVIFFVSHRHGDHYNPKILKFARELPRCRFVISDDVSAAKEGIAVGSGQHLEQPDFRLQTLRSNDEGVAFLLQIDGKRIYHAGDLNWWHWEGEPDEWNAEMTASYKREIENLCGAPVDIAFQPVDPRLEGAYSCGIDYLMKTADVCRVIPMHFGDEPEIIKKLIDDPVSGGFRDKILPFTARGQRYTLPE